MRNVTLSFSEEMLERGREYARVRGLSLNALIREALRHEIERDSTQSMDALLTALDAADCNSNGAPSKREELYER